MNNDEMKRHIAAKIESGEIGPRLPFQRAMPDDYEIHFRGRGGHYFWRLRGVDGIRSASTDPMEVIRHAWLHLLSGQATKVAGLPLAPHMDLMVTPESIGAEAPEVPRLDFSKPPPGYEVGYFDGWWWSLQGSKRTANEKPFTSKENALTAAWAHHKARHDPPGMETWNESEGPPGGVWMVAVLGESGHFADYRTQVEVRDDAWAHYEDALEVADLLDADDFVITDMWPARLAWPRPLAWTAEQRAEVRRWVTDGADMTGWAPEVLRG